MEADILYTRYSQYVPGLKERPRLLIFARTFPVQSAKWIDGKRKQPRPGHLLMLSLCGRVIEGVREVTNR